VNLIGVPPLVQFYHQFQMFYHKYKHLKIGKQHLVFQIVIILGIVISLQILIEQWYIFVIRYNKIILLNCIILFLILLFILQLNLPTDDDIFDSVSVTQRALSEYMEQQNHLNMYQSRLQNSG